ncbi:MAG: efflux RND transporter periplasmic adaptor subunit [Clostridiales bacterium]|jgi:multidrug efflux pump subunit AcrA (membrane-fusion protein)|nr:efflux RND transporter periplasmic adaptor subunit [Clostridiales bacterium]
MKKRIIIGLAAAALIVLIGIGAVNAKKAGETSGIPKNAFPVNIEEAKTDTITSKITVKGFVAMKESEHAFAAQDGTAARLFVKEGDEVKAGDVLLAYDEKPLEDLNARLSDLELSLSGARLALREAGEPASETDLLAAENAVKAANKDIEDLSAKLSLSDKDISSLEEDLADASKKYADMRELFDGGVISKNELDGYKDAESSAKSRLETARTSKESLLLNMETAKDALSLAERRYGELKSGGGPLKETQRERAEISVKQAENQIAELNRQIADFKREETAPANGVILTLNAREGAFLTRGSEIAEIADTTGNNLKIEARIPEGDANGLEAGATADIYSGVLGKERIKGKITRIMPTAAETRTAAGNTETTVTAEIALESSASALRSGNTVDIDIVTKVYENVVVVPIMATFSDSGGKDCVNIMNDDYTVSKKEVELLGYNGLYIGVNGIEPGQKVITTISPRITDGSYVRPVIAQKTE